MHAPTSAKARLWKSGSPTACCAINHAASAPSLPAMSSAGHPYSAMSSRRRAAFLRRAKMCLPGLLPAHPEDVAVVGIGSTGEIDAYNRDTRMRKIDGDDRLI